jgi:hypothetical protein
MPLTIAQANNYLNRNPDLKEAFNATGPDSQANNFDTIEEFASAHYDYATSTNVPGREGRIENRDFNVDVPLPAPVVSGLTQEQLAEEIGKIDITPSYGGDTIIRQGPTQEEIIEAFRQAQPELDTSGIMGAIGTPTAGVDTPATGLYQPLEGLQAQVGQQATDTQAATGLFKPLTNIQTQIGTAGQPGTTDDEAVAPTGLFAGQAGIMSGQAGIMSGQAGLAGTQQQLQQQQAQIGTGVTGLQETIGQAAGVADDGVTPTAPTGLFAGQAGIMTGQERLGRDIGRDLSGLGGDIAAFRTAQQAYQRQAETARGDIQGTQRAGQRELERQIGSANIASNRAAEMLTQQRQAEAQAARLRASTQPTGIQQQAQSFAQTAGRNLALPTQQQQQNVSALGPMSQDPRDVLIQNLIRNASLMNRRPV